MSETSRAPLDRALQLSGQMLDAAGSGNWNAMGDLQSECDALVQREHPADEVTRRALTLLHERHQTLLTLAARARDDVGRELDQHRHKHRAVSAYLDSSASG